MSTNCRVVQILEPETDTVVSPQTSSVDESYDERGREVLTIGQAEVTITFKTPKVSASYSFEYLYVEAIGESNPGGIDVVPIIRAKTGFVVELAGAPDTNNYALKWRVKVDPEAEDDGDTGEAGDPDSAHTPLTIGAETQIIPFTNARLDTDYSFSEWRVENLVDDPATMQGNMNITLIQRTELYFKISINPPADTANYQLWWKTP